MPELCFFPPFPEAGGKLCCEFVKATLSRALSVVLPFLAAALG